MRFEIKFRWSWKPSIFAEIECDADTSEGVKLGLAIKWAVGSDADLTGADLTGVDLTGVDLWSADLTGAVLRRADLRDAVLWGADLRRADLTSADLTGADLTGADLTGADLRGAVLRGAVLRRADLRDADLTSADLTGVHEDFLKVMAWAAPEAPALLEALRAGKINGSVYEGECACLVGTVAKARKVNFATLEHNESRPIERLFLAIRPGHTPDINPIAKIVENWLVDFIASQNVAT